LNYSQSEFMGVGRFDGFRAGRSARGPFEFGRHAVAGTKGECGTSSVFGAEVAVAVAIGVVRAFL